MAQASGIRKGGRLVWGTVKALLYATFALVACVGLLRAWTAEGATADRRAELERLQGQLLQAQMKGEDLKAKLAAFAQRPDVRMHTIRSELGMLRGQERFYVFK